MAARTFFLFLITLVCGAGLSCSPSRQDDMPPPGSVLLHGAGATFPAPLYNKRYDDPQKRTALKRLVQWCLTEGQAFNETLGYLRLAPHVVTLGLEAVQGL